MIFDSIPVEYKDLLRNYHPKWSQIGRIHRWRYNRREDDLLQKIVYIDGLKMDEKLAKSIYERTVTYLDEDWTGMEIALRYSIKKHARWELPGMLEWNLPIFQDGYRTLPVMGTSLARFNSFRSYFYSPRRFLWYKDLKYYSHHVKSLTTLDSKGKTKSYRGGMNAGNIGSIIKGINEENTGSTPRLHIQYQTLEFVQVSKSYSKKKYDPYYDYKYYKPMPIFNSFILEEEWPFCDCPHDCPTCRGYDERDYVEMDCSYFEGIYHRQSFTFGDYFNIHNIRQEKRFNKREEWVLV